MFQKCFENKSISRELFGMQNEINVLSNIEININSTNGWKPKEKCTHSTNAQVECPISSELAGFFFVLFQLPLNSNELF